MTGAPSTLLVPRSRPPGARALKSFGHLLALIVALAACGAAVPPTAVAQPPAPHMAVFANGTELAGVVSAITDPEKAKLDGRALFDPANPFRLVRLSAQVSRLPEAFVELQNGDRLPGLVERNEPEGFAWRTLPAAAMPMNHPVSVPATLVVAVAGDIAWGQMPAVDGGGVADAGLVRVRRDRVRRIVWKRTGIRPYQPRMLFLRDGFSIAYRSLRWTDEGVIALLEDGSTQRHSFTGIGELHLPAPADPWAPWFDALSGEAALVTIETKPGVRVTTPRTRYREARGLPAATIMVQPSWSLDPLFIPVPSVSQLVCHLPTELPLTWLTPSRVNQQSAFGGSWTWQVNRNVYDGPLHAAGPPAGWGFGVQARSELTFPLAAGVRGFRAAVGLDRAVGAGGCIRAAVHVGDAGSPPVWESGVLVGSDTGADSGLIALEGPAGGQRELTLVVDDAHRDRPPGADPFDIRDGADWIDPRFELDAAEVKNRIAAGLTAAVPAWVGWKVEPTPGGSTRTIDTLDPILPLERAGWATTTVTTGAPLRLTREWSAVPAGDANLVIAASAFGPTKAAIELRVDGWRWELPLAGRSAATAVPFVLPLGDRPRTPLRVELVVPVGLQVQWHALGLTGPLDSTWLPLEPTKLESAAGSTFKRRGDGATVVSMPPPANDAYAVRLKSPMGGIRAVRIDALTDPSLPKPAAGPGRGPSGSFRVSRLSVSAVAGDERSPVPIVAAFGNPMHHPAHGPWEATRPNPTAPWQAAPAKTTNAVFHVAADAPAAEEIVLDIEYRAEQTAARMLGDSGVQSLGCFRVFGSPEPDARLPVTNVAMLVREPVPAAGPPGQAIVGTRLEEEPAR